MAESGVFYTAMFPPSMIRPRDVLVAVSIALFPFSAWPQVGQPSQTADLKAFDTRSGAPSLPEHSTDAVILAVAVDGSAQFRTIQDAVNAASKYSGQQADRRFIIRIKPGIYREKLIIPDKAVPITLVGEDAVDTVLTFDDCADRLRADGTKVGTFNSASTTVLGNDFIAENLTFQNAHGAGSQALAIHVAGDRSVFRKCRFLGWQDTVLLRQGRQYFEECFIEGHVDFIFGGATAFFERCEIRCLGNGFITAASTPEKLRNGFVFSNCRITSDEKATAYLGRPWRPFASVVFLKCYLPTSVRLEGWHNWGDPTREQTARFSEYQSRGPGANVGNRVPWARQLTDDEAIALTAPNVLGGEDRWNPTNVSSVLQPGVGTGSKLTAERIAALPEAERQSWQAYWERSTQHLNVDKSTLAAELQANGLAEPLRPPNGKDFRLPSHTAGFFASDEAQKLAEIVLSFQTPSGGWSKAVDYSKGPRSPGMHWSSQASPAIWHYVGTFDNGATIEQMRLLAGVYRITGRQECRDAFLKGLDYILDAQFPNGGWPQVYPLEGGYHDAITFNDDSMVHVLKLLQDVVQQKPEFAFIESRERAAAALSRGIECLLKTQFVQNGTRTVWCAQHDPITLVPVAARLKEPASLSGSESVGIVKFLMGLPNASPEIVQAIENASTWFKQSKLIGLKATKRDGRSFWEKDPVSTQPVWARFYDLATNQPLFSGAEDGIIYDSFAAMWQNNRFGYDFYTGKPQELLTKEQKQTEKLLRP